MNLTDLVDLVCQDTTYEVTDIKYFNGELTLKADYATDMEGRSCMFNFIYNTSIIRSPDSVLTFDAISQSQNLIILSNPQELHISTLIFTALGYLSLAIFVLSLGYKMVGAETVTCCQLVYLANVLYQRQYIFFNEVKQMKMVTGGWFLFY
jgi:hypothetical protein